MAATELTRLGKKMRKLLIETKTKNRMGSLADAGESVADYICITKNRKKIKEKIIREIEF